MTDKARENTRCYNTRNVSYWSCFVSTSSVIVLSNIRSLFVTCCVLSCSLAVFITFDGCEMMVEIQIEFQC